MFSIPRLTTYFKWSLYTWYTWPMKMTDSFLGLNQAHGSVEWPRQPCSSAKQLWLGYTANAVYIQHAGLEPKPLHYNVVSEVTETWLDQVCKFMMPLFFSLWRHDGGEANITFLWVDRRTDWEANKGQIRLSSSTEKRRAREWSSHTTTALMKFKPELLHKKTL